MGRLRDHISHPNFPLYKPLRPLDDPPPNRPRIRLLFGPRNLKLRITLAEQSPTARPAPSHPSDPTGPRARARFNTGTGGIDWRTGARTRRPANTARRRANRKANGSRPARGFHHRLQRTTRSPDCIEDFDMTRMTGQTHRDLLSFCFFSVVLFGTWFL
jgi:hypothetical protein